LRSRNRYPSAILNRTGLPIRLAVNPKLRRRRRGWQFFLPSRRAARGRRWSGGELPAELAYCVAQGLGRESLSLWQWSFDTRKEIGSVAANSTDPQAEEQDARDFFMGDEVVRRVLRIAGIFFLIVVVLISTVWANLAILYQLPGFAAIRVGACLVFDVVALGAVTGLVLRRYRRAVLVYAAVYAGLLVWWVSIHPSNDRDWATAVAHGVTGSVNGDQLTVENVRNFRWDSETEFVERWERRTYDLSKLRSLDLYLVYWMGPAIAHTIISFGFQDGRYLDFSIEVRRTRNDEYSAIAGFFKTNELVYIAADERDLLNLRKVRHEDVRLYRLGTPPEGARALLVQYIDAANDLAAHPRFYNTLTTNCTTTIFEMTRTVTSSIPFDWRIILTGYLPGYFYERGAVDTRIPLGQLSHRADVNGRIDMQLNEKDFSSFIRDGVPKPH
jgi:hypothetical protein